MRYNQTECVYCKQKFTETDDAVACPVCGSPHHRECWSRNGCCVNEEKHAEGFVWQMPAPAPAAEEPKRLLQTAEGRDIIECPYCGAQNYSDELYCAMCHEPINDNASAAPGNPLSDEEQRQRMFEDFTKYGGLDPNASVEDITVTELSAYLRKRPGAYIRRFSAMSKTGSRMSWNWAAFGLSAVSAVFNIFLAPIWFFYRKLNKAGILLAALLLVSVVASSVVTAADPAYYTYATKMQVLRENMEARFDKKQAVAESDLLTLEELKTNVDSATNAYYEDCNSVSNVYSFVSMCVFSFLLPVLLGIFANAVYYRKARADIHRLREEYGKTEAFNSVLSRQGGVSVGGAALGAVYALGLMLLSTYLPEWISMQLFAK